MGKLFGGGKTQKVVVDNTQSEALAKQQAALLEQQKKMLEEQRKKQEEMIRQYELKKKEEEKIAQETAKEQTGLVTADKEAADQNVDYASSNTSAINTDWIENTNIDQEEDSSIFA